MQLVGQVRDDSRRVQPGDLFVARRGLTVDGVLADVARTTVTWVRELPAG